jgi:hypothetical protein
MDPERIKPIIVETYASHTEAFDYDNLRRLLKEEGHLPTLVEYSNYVATFFKGYFYLDRSMKTERGRGLVSLVERSLMRSPPTCGWKFQFSIDDTDNLQPRSNLARAWSIIERHVVDNGIWSVKLFPGGKPLHQQFARERGKQITIYLFKEKQERSLEEWQNIFQRMENDLAAARIVPSYRAYGCRRVPGSNYLSYRNDRSTGGKYIGTSVTRDNYNYTGAIDPYEGMVIQTPLNAILEPEWQEPPRVQP